MIVASIIAGSFTTVPAGYRGVVIRFSAVTGGIMNEGLQTKLPFIDSVEKMSVQTQKYEADSAAVTNDLQDVSTTIALNWHLDPGMAAEVYRTLGLEFIDRIAAPAIQETIKQITAKYNAEDLILRRDEVKVEAQQRQAEAKGEAAARIAKAIGEAEYIRVVTESQVAANRDIAGSLTPEVLQYILLDRLGEDIKVMVIPSGQGLDLVLPRLQS